MAAPRYRQHRLDAFYGKTKATESRSRVLPTRRTA